MSTPSKNKKSKNFLRIWEKSHGWRFLLLRLLLLIVGVFAGLFLVWLGSFLSVFGYVYCLLGERVEQSVIILLMSLPTLTFLWLFRTRDTGEQLKKSDEQLKKSDETLKTNILFHSQKLLLNKEDKIGQVIGFLQLINFQREGLFLDIIQKTFKIMEVSGINLEGANLEGANLEGANLHRVNLQEAKLQGADLREANLQRADLRGANLQGVMWKGVMWKGANLDGTIFSSQEAMDDAIRGGAINAEKAKVEP